MEGGQQTDRHSKKKRAH